MDFSLTTDQQAVCDAVQKICAGFDDDYWLERDKSGEFPEDFYRAIADGGWLGIGWELRCPKSTAAQAWE
jgi:acyl-CoA dehydrogenase